MASIKSKLSGAVLESSLYEEALTHRSAGRVHNERLEFLGDSVLSIVITEYIYKALPEANEGDLSRLRASLVNKDSLAKIAKEYELGELIHLGQGERKSGGFRRNSILADALEAVIGAVYLVEGLERVKAFIAEIYGERLSKLPSLNVLKDPKSRLQEYLQGRGLPLPIYDVVSVEGDPHSQVFTASCEIEALGFVVQGAGASRRKAEQAAASSALDQLSRENLSPV